MKWWSETDEGLPVRTGSLRSRLKNSILILTKEILIMTFSALLTIGAVALISMIIIMWADS